MDPLCFKVPRNVQETIRVEHWSLPFFYDYYHYHNECQLTFVLKGSGKLYSSGFNSDFKKGELYLIGKNVPHVFKSDVSSKTTDNPVDKAGAVTIFFDGDRFISFFDEFPEALPTGKTFCAFWCNCQKIGSCSSGQSSRR